MGMFVVHSFTDNDDPHHRSGEQVRHTHTYTQHRAFVANSSKREFCLRKKCKRINHLKTIGQCRSLGTIVDRLKRMCHYFCSFSTFSMPFNCSKATKNVVLLLSSVLFFVVYIDYPVLLIINSKIEVKSCVGFVSFFFACVLLLHTCLPACLPACAWFSFSLESFLWTIYHTPYTNCVYWGSEI